MAKQAGDDQRPLRSGFGRLLAVLVVICVGVAVAANVGFAASRSDPAGCQYGPPGHQYGQCCGPSGWQYVRATGPSVRPSQAVLCPAEAPGS